MFQLSFTKQQATVLRTYSKQDIQGDISLKLIFDIKEDAYHDTKIGP
jgi:hypothetical protein